MILVMGTIFLNSGRRLLSKIQDLVDFVEPSASIAESVPLVNFIIAVIKEDVL